MKRQRPRAPTRSCTDVGSGDYVKIGSQWKKIVSNTAEGHTHPPREGWTVTTEDGRSWSMYDVLLYAKAEDLTNG